jgi:hypothetical protein
MALEPLGDLNADTLTDVSPDWLTPCIVCGEVPTVPVTEMCGPCTFGEAKTADGGWSHSLGSEGD